MAKEITGEITMEGGEISKNSENVRYDNLLLYFLQN
jgi:hypothetical protein